MFRKYSASSVYDDLKESEKMENEKLKNWLDLTKQYAAESFWKEVLNQKDHPYSTRIKKES